LQAKVVPPPLHHRHVQVAAEGPGQDGDVLVEELLLEVLGAGRDHHPATQLGGGKQVGERLAGAGSGFGQKEAALMQRALHGFRQDALRRPFLVVGQGPREARSPEERRLDGCIHAGHLSGWPGGTRATWLNFRQSAGLATPYHHPM
jgi:hypothetical protein